MSHKIIQDSLPKDGVPANGQFNPADNLVLNSFDNKTGQTTDSPYNTIYIGDAANNLVGSSTTPYLHMALPAYIPTLYENIYHIQTNLKDEIVDNVLNEREYPTSNAVKNYVTTQLQGRELLTPSSTGEVTISTVLTTSFLKASKTQGLNVGIREIDGKQVYATTYNINRIGTSRDGAEKICINISPLGAGTDPNNPNDIYNLQIVLDADQFFVAGGKEYKCYVPACLGDVLSMVQYIDQNGKDRFFVLSYGGVFNDIPYYPLPLV